MVVIYDSYKCRVLPGILSSAELSLWNILVLPTYFQQDSWSCGDQLLEILRYVVLVSCVLQAVSIISRSPVDS
jgi:hypothetical protein